jgi:glycosyltransferase involved in cell wall biosynthesis
MKKIVVITVTWNRLHYTKQYLSELKQKGGYLFEHIIVDNGSTDGTIQYLIEQGYDVISLNKNVGIWKAFKIAIKYAKEKYKPDYIVKFDNDCEILTDNILLKIMQWYEKGCKSYVVAPLDLQILPTHQPKVIKKITERNEALRYVEHVGGIFLVAPADALYELCKMQDKEVSGDLLRGRKFWSIGYSVCYFENLQITHQGLHNSVRKYIL